MYKDSCRDNSYNTEGNKVPLRCLQAIRWQRFIHALPGCMLTDSIGGNRDCCASFELEDLVLVVLVLLLRLTSNVMHLLSSLQVGFEWDLYEQ